MELPTNYLQIFNSSSDDSSCIRIINFTICRSQFSPFHCSALSKLRTYSILKYVLKHFIFTNKIEKIRSQEEKAKHVYKGTGFKQACEAQTHTRINIQYFSEQRQASKTHKDKLNNHRSNGMYESQINCQQISVKRNRQDATSLARRNDPGHLATATQNSARGSTKTGGASFKS